MFEQLEGTLSDAYCLLWGRYGDEVPAVHSYNSSSTSSTPTHNFLPTLLISTNDTPSAHNSPSSSSSTRLWSISRSPSISTLAKIRWAFKDKKRAEQLLVSFNDTNVAIFEQTKLLLLSSTLGRELDYCRSLEESGNARALGLDTDARLRIIAVDEESAMQLELEIPASSIHRTDPTFGTGVSICTVDSDQLALEFKTIPVGTSDQHMVFRRARQLAALLHQAKDPSFRVLQCRGYAHLASENRFAFLYNIPTCYEPKPTSLLDELRNRKFKPSLGDKFRLAVVLASSMAQLHMVQWESTDHFLHIYGADCRNRSTRASAARILSSFEEQTTAPETRSNTISLGYLALNTAVQKTTLPQGLATTTLRMTSIATQIAKANRPGVFQRFTISMHSVSLGSRVGLC